MCQKIKKCRFSDTPLWGNKLGVGEEPISGDITGEVVIHREGTWEFQCPIGAEILRIYAVHVDGVPVNFLEFLGEK